MHRPRKVFRIERFAPAGAPPVAPGPAASPDGGQGRRPDPARGERAVIRAAVSAGDGLRRAARELGEVVADTAAAANAVLAASEQIELAVDRLRMLAGRGAASAVADEILEQAASIMQACGFQDLTGQRIGNVVSLLRDLECRLAALREVFEAGAEEAAHPPAGTDAPASGGLENGPKLPSDSGHLTQAQIDLVFADPGHFAALSRLVER